MTERAAAPMRWGLGMVLGLVLAGCATGDRSAANGGRLPASAAASQIDAASEREREQAVALAEQEVAGSPGDPALRAALGQAYLAAGRPASAVAAFSDALALGGAGPDCIVGLALGRIVLGESEAAVRLLDEWQGSLPASDMGLALALAGETSRGVEVLGSALRAGDTRPRLRQNLAYAYALDGRWREAALMAGQDLPPAQAQARIEDWARLGQPDAAAWRVAYALGATLRADPGYPAALALAPAAAPAVGAPAELATVPSS